MAEQTLQDVDGEGELAAAELKELTDHWVQVIDRWVRRIDQGMGVTAEGADPAVTPGLGLEAGLDVPGPEAG